MCGSSSTNPEHEARPKMGMLEEIVKNAIKLGSIVDLVKHLARLNPLVTYYIKVNLRKTNAIKKVLYLNFESKRYL